MARFVIAFGSETEGVQQKIVEADSSEIALRLFFEHFTGEYSPNKEGFTYFREDFFDSEHPMGSIVEV